MDLPQILTTMRDSIFEVFDNMLFLPVGISEKKDGIEPWLDSLTNSIGAVMPFDGAVTGEFLFVIPRALAMDITTNFLGLESVGATPQQMEDTIKEVLNMVGGRSLSLIDASGEFKLSLPEIVPSIRQRYGLFSDKSGGSIFIESDTHHLLFAVRTG